MSNWCPVPGWEGQYAASDGGEIRSIDRAVCYVSRRGAVAIRRLKGRILRPYVGPNGYPMVTLHGRGLREVRCVHEIVATTFLGPKKKGLEVCHRDGNRLNNAAENLRWDTRTANHADKKEHGTYLFGINHHNAKLCATDITDIASMYADGLNCSEISRQKGVSRKTVARLLRGESYRPEFRK